MFSIRRMHRSTYFTRVSAINGRGRQLTAEGDLPPGKEQKCVFYEGLATRVCQDTVFYTGLAPWCKETYVNTHRFCSPESETCVFYEGSAIKGQGKLGTPPRNLR